MPGDVELYPPPLVTLHCNSLAGYFGVCPSPHVASDILP